MEYKGRSSSNGKQGDQGGQHQEQNELREFFYRNAYPNDPERAKRMMAKVRYDLKPFAEYIKKSITHLEKAARVSAQCVEVKHRTVLRPLFSMLRLKASDLISIPLPTEHVYVLEWDEEWGDVEQFEALYRGRRPAAEADDVLDVYNSKLFFFSATELDTQAEYQVYLKGEEDGRAGHIRALDYTRLSDYRLESGNAVFSSAQIKNGDLLLQCSGAPEKTVTLFGKHETLVQNKKNLSLDNAALTMENTRVEIWDEAARLAVAFCDDKEVGPLFLDGAEVAYDVLGKEEICHLLQDSRVMYRDKKLETTAPELVNQEKVRIGILDFEVTDPLGRLKKRFGENGVYVELLEDSSFSDDLYSNTSHFFKETAERVKDEDGNLYQIGYRNEKFNQIEIALLGKGARPVPMEKVPEKLFAEPNTRQLKMQRNAIRVLMDKPCAEHTPLLELMQDRNCAEWGSVPYEDELRGIHTWYKLKNPNYEGCETQREFVAKALATPDFAILEGPPGSGKTTTILEIIAQMVMRGKKVMLAASTNAAIDNILERLDDLPPEVRNQILAVRLGTDGAISESVQSYTLFDVKDKDVKNEIISRANLVCGTIIGVLQHPEFELGSKPAVPIFDCLIVDEASKTTFQEFLVPAVFAKKWILSGDLRQLTPYIEQDNIESSLAQIEEFNEAAQRAQSILMTLENDVYFKPENRVFRFCIPVDAATLSAVPKLAEEEAYSHRRIAIIGGVREKMAVTPEEFLSGSERGVLVYGCDVLFCEKSAFEKVEAYLPADFIPLLMDGATLAHYQSDGALRPFDTKMARSIVKKASEVREVLNETMRTKTWAGEIAWRLCRIQELFLLSELEGGSDGKIQKYREEISRRIPRYAETEIRGTVSLLTEIALPSVIQILQRGVTKSVVKNKNITTLNSGFEERDLKERHTLVEYQHRMHGEIAAFSAKHIYEGKALKDGSVIDRCWEYGQYPGRAVWLDVSTREDCGNQNSEEVKRIKSELEAFLEYAKAHPKEKGEPWSIALLTYYRKQEDALKKMVKELVKGQRASSYQEVKECNAEIMIYTVDKFQGKEADVVFLSMIKANGAPLGFMDSPNRLNVALTRAKYQMVVVGCREYFFKCKSTLLKDLAQEYKQ